MVRLDIDFGFESLSSSEERSMTSGLPLTCFPLEVPTGFFAGPSFCFLDVPLGVEVNEGALKNVWKERHSLRS